MPVFTRPPKKAKKDRVSYEPPAQSLTEEPAKNIVPPVEYIDSPKQISPSGRCVIFFKPVTDYEAMQHHQEGFKVYRMSDAVTKEETVAYCYGLEQRFELVGDCLYGNLRFKKSGEQMTKEGEAEAVDQKTTSIVVEKDSNKNSEDEDDLARLVYAAFMSSLPEASPSFPMQSKGKKSNPSRRFNKELKNAVVPSVEDNPVDPAC